MKTIALRQPGASKPRTRIARTRLGSALLSCTILIATDGLLAACGDDENSGSDNEGVCEAGEWSNWEQATCQTCEGLVFECESLDWELFDPRKSTWDGETGIITVYAKPGRVQIVSAQVTGSVVDERIQNDYGPPVTMEGTIDGDVIRFDVSEHYEEDHTFLIAEFRFEETCGQIYTYDSLAQNLKYDRIRPLLIDCARD